MCVLCVHRERRPKIDGRRKRTAGRAAGGTGRAAGSGVHDAAEDAPTYWSSVIVVPSSMGGGLKTLGLALPLPRRGLAAFFMRPRGPIVLRSSTALPTAWSVL